MAQFISISCLYKYAFGTEGKARVRFQNMEGEGGGEARGDEEKAGESNLQNHE